MRKSVKNFAEEMENTLQINDHKGGWQKRKCTIEYLRGRLLEEVGEYLINDNPDELVDIANFCLMIYERETKLEELKK